MQEEVTQKTIALVFKSSTVIQRPSANGDGQALRCRSLPQ